ncbi:class I SAM-dependent methyltransferase [Rhizobium leguminosarum]|uniref:class I SAM-dependent methyltransferase n=1 Tax=Rhizobium TaxID=379 RepID=UPI001478AC53|nr:MULTISPECIES: class I SAM-dependent methyltransferase [Rhizobium]MBY5353770.1 class I SAM-dependent methyltransferase [Rhizobium leguminosarum]MBY5370747.1 class I SAM-dependent methyltransferase [Rhizobium leguminosarum]MBY5453666.1 class I SAM-dependent methyltransferase [Rhizobium leguminosarum]NNG74235.1 class I SAM-dependent methyltransferase [Rhizobium laguerreae]NNH42153.1 class I SAM-dependent methyltransferase [Rhizobium laguerreae]
MSYIRATLNRFPGLKSRLRRLREQLLPAASVSSGYVEIDAGRRDSESSRLAASWKAGDLPARQRALVERQLKEYRGGTSIDVFDVFTAALRGIDNLPANGSLLEIGCSSGYYSEVLEINRLLLHYRGCDYSDAFIDMARRIYPGLPFDVEDATRLSYHNDAFDVVVSGCCLLHIPNYEAAIAESARVAKGYVIFHRTPVVYGEPTKYFRKQAYGVETIEIHFSESQLLDTFRVHGLELHAIFTLNENADPRDSSKGNASRTYVCRKQFQ